MSSEYLVPTNDSNNEKEKPIQCYEQPAAGKALHVYISGPLEHPKIYTEIIHKIKSASVHDTVYMYLNTPGGRLDTGVQFMSAMRSSNARIVTVLEGEVCSLGTIIFLCGEEFIVQDHSLMMIHNHSGGQYGKGHEYLAQAEATSNWFESIARDVYEGFLTPEEIVQLMEGKDFWFQTSEIKKRLTKMVREMKKKIKNEEKREKEKTDK